MKTFNKKNTISHTFGNIMVFTYKMTAKYEFCFESIMMCTKDLLHHKR